MMLAETARAATNDSAQRYTATGSIRQMRLEPAERITYLRAPMSGRGAVGLLAWKAAATKN
jgi:hypothetical protein